MAKQIEILITASIPDDNDELGHEAIIATRDGANAMVEVLKKLGLADAVRKSDLVNRRGPKAPKATQAPAEVPELVFPYRSHLLPPAA